MRYEALHPDVLMFVGDDHESVATAFLDGDEVLLVDALGSLEDAAWMHDVLCRQMGKTVRLIVATHYMGDHIAGLSLFPEALGIAHRLHRHGFLSQNRRDDALYRAPRVQFDTAMRLRWGRHDLVLHHNPGKTVDHLCIDVPTADLACAGDNIVGNIVYLSKADPAMIRGAIARIRQLGRGTIIGGHMGCFPARVLDHATHYLDRLQDTVIRIRAAFPPAEAQARIGAIAIESCLAPQVEPMAFEREWHQRNLEVIVAQSTFEFDAALAAREARA
jgi:cyclase